MMHKKVIFLILTLISYGVSGQNYAERYHSNRDCEVNAGLIDSLYAFDWNETEDSWDAVSIRQYFYTDRQNDEVLFINATDRSPIRKWEYFYDAAGNRNLDVSSTWVNNSWYSTLRKESEFDTENRKINEIRYGYKGKKWIFNSFTYYEYQGKNLSAVHYQLKDINGSYYDQSYSLYTYSDGFLREVTGYDGTAGSVTGRDGYFYDGKGRLSEIITFGYDTTQNTSELVPLKRRLFTYDEYSLKREELFLEMTDGQWHPYHKYIIYYKLDGSDKVTVCHNGQSLCISKNALKGHLEHGDKLGSCPDENHEKGDNKFSEGYSVRAPFKIFPNPAGEKAVIQIDASIDPDIYRIELIDNFGKVLRSYDAHLKNEIVIYRGNLKDGTYFIRFTSSKVYSAGIIFR